MGSRGPDTEGPGDTGHGGARSLSELVRDNTDDVINEWTRRARELGASTSGLVDALPQVLRDIADFMDARSPEERSPPAAATAHAVDRLGRGFELDELIREYGLLRGVILDFWRDRVDDEIPVSELERLDQAFNDAIAESSVRYAEARERALVAIDRVAEAAFGTTDLASFLARLLGAILELTPSVDTAAVLLKQGDRLRVTAAVGVEERAAEGFEVGIGDGFSGAVARLREPILLRNAAEDPLVVNEVIRHEHIRALYGVPLIHHGELIGVAHVGSRTAFELSDEDMLLVRLMAARATAVILQAQLVEREREAHRQVIELVEQERQSRERAESAQAAVEDARQRAEENATLLDTILARAPVGFAFLDPSLRYLRINQALAWAHGVPALEHIGRTPSEVLTDRKAARLFEDYLGEAVRTRQPLTDRELTLERAHQPPRHLLTSYYPITAPDGTLIGVGKIALDITERKRAADVQRFMAEASRLLARSLDFDVTLKTLANLAVPQVADGCVVDVLDGGRRRTLTAAFREDLDTRLVDRWLAKFGGEARAGMPVTNVLATGTPELHADVQAELASAPPDDEHVKLMRELDVRSVIIVPLVAREHVLGALTFLRCSGRPAFDENDLEGAQDLAGRAALAADNALLYEDARLAARQREDILAVVSHDLRNPLNSLSLAASLVAKRVRSLMSDATTERHLQTIQRSVTRMTSLIHQVLTMGSIQAGALTLDRQPCEVGGLVDEAVSMQAGMAEEKGVSIEVAVGERAAKVMADRERLLQVFANLLGNAIKFTGQGDVIVVAAERSGSEVCFAVKDTGPGIAAEDVPRIFEPYFSGPHGQKGTGLGLYIAKGIVDAHGGRIWVESTPGRGSTFRFCVPLA